MRYDAGWSWLWGPLDPSLPKLIPPWLRLSELGTVVPMTISAASAWSALPSAASGPANLAARELPQIRSAPDAEWITPDVLLTEAALRMRDKNIGCLPVGENDRLVGMITDRDLACRAVADGLNPQNTKARDVMTKGITWCFDDESVADAVQRMEQKQIHHMPVLDRQKRMVGILSLSDLALKGPQELFTQVSKLTSRDASRHASMPLTH